MNAPFCRALGTARVLVSWLLLAFVSAFLPVISEAAAQEQAFGAFGPEGTRMREQLWIFPSGEEGRPLRATVFRPAVADEERNSQTTLQRPLVVINHGTDEATRLAVSMPVYYWLSRWFVERGYVVVLPQRRGHGATGGALAESIGTCDNPDHYASGIVAADDIAATIGFMTNQAFVASNETVVVGLSTGGWAALALAARNPSTVRAVVNFAGGRGGHAYGRANAICGMQQLQRAARTYGTTARIPTIWYYAENDSYFGPALVHSLRRNWKAGGGIVESHELSSYASEGHALADDRAGWDVWGESLERFLMRTQHKDALDTQISQISNELNATPEGELTMSSGTAGPSSVK